VSRAYYVTTPIYYVNAEPHIGHAYTFCVADTLRRHYALHGREAWLVTGTDEHGEKIVEAAAQRGVAPKAFADEISAKFRAAWEEVGLSVDRFVRTTDADHVRNVQALLQRVYDAGWIEKREYEGLYCVGCERFLTDRDLEDGKCRDHERTPEQRREANYFFLMSRRFAWLRDTIERTPDFIRPERYRNEALAMLRDESGLGDLSISRPKARLDWGIELPFDRDHVCYVWFDALISYLTGAGFPDDPRFAARWADAEHLIGKDILKPHAIFWPIMLDAMGLPLPRHVSVHGYWNVEGRKMSKSLGNVLSPGRMRERYGFEAFRYAALREMSFGLDADLRDAALVERINADLANNLGNLVSRTLNLVAKLAGGRVPEPGAAPGDAERELIEAAAAGARLAFEQTERLELHRALESIVGVAGAANRYLDGQAPWKAVKEPGGDARARTALYHTCQALRALALLAAPFLPRTAQAIAERLGSPRLLETTRLPEGALAWDALPPGSATTKGDALFPRLEVAAGG
jgi:methionyl-tRNA synthetase